MLEIILSTTLAIVWLGIIPFFLGIPFASKLNKKSILFTLISGFALYISIFQVLHVGFLLLYNNLTTLCWVFAIIVISLSVMNLIKYKSEIVEITNIKNNFKIYKSILWIVVIILIVYQVYMTAMYQFIDGDDSVYAVTAAATDYHGIAYGYEPYSGSNTVRDLRHAFSGAPILMAFLSRVIMVHTATVHHIIFPVVIVILMYMIYVIIAKLLMKNSNQNMAVFMIFINLLYIFGNASIYCTPTFLLTRTAQGKSILANIVVPITIMLLINIVNDVQEDNLKKINFVLSVIYKRWKVLAYTCVSLIPAISFAIIYIIFYRDYWYI